MAQYRLDGLGDNAQRKRQRIIIEMPFAHSILRCGRRLVRIVCCHMFCSTHTFQILHDRWMESFVCAYLGRIVPPANTPAIIIKIIIISSSYSLLCGAASSRLSSTIETTERKRSKDMCENVWQKTHEWLQTVSKPVGSELMLIGNTRNGSKTHFNAWYHFVFFSNLVWNFIIRRIFSPVIFLFDSSPTLKCFKIKKVQNLNDFSEI